MTDDNKQSIEYKSIKKWLLIGAAIVLAILVSYFTLTDIPFSNSDSLNEILLKKISTGDSYNWRNLLLISLGIILLPVCYLAATNKLKGIYKKLISGYRVFKSPIQLHEEIKDVAIILVLLVAFAFFIKGLYDNCCGWWSILSTRLSSPIEPLNFRNVLIGIAGVVTLIFAGWRTYIANQTRILDKGRRFDERFDNAVEALSKELNESSFPAHLGAISSLRALAIDSSEDTQRCLDIICSCNQWMEGYVDKFIELRRLGPYSSWLLKEGNRISNKNNGSEITLLQEKRSQEALIAIQHILTEISVKRAEQPKELNLNNKMLCGISLKGLQLDGINFENTYLVAASMKGVSLKEANLDGANLQRANLSKANLQRAYLGCAHLEGASLDISRLEGVLLNGAHLEDASLSYSHLEGASIDGAHLEMSMLNNVYLEGASLTGCHLEGAFLDNSSLEGASLDRAYLDGVYLCNSHLVGTSLKGAHLKGSFLMNVNLQGANLDNVNLSCALLLDCNLYGTTLQNTKSENVMFNDTVKIDYIRGEEERKQYLDNICQHLKPMYDESFMWRMDNARQARDNAQEPKGLETIRGNTIVFLDNQGMYDIRENYLANLQEGLQKLVNERGGAFLNRMKNCISLLNNTQKINIEGNIKILNQNDTKGKYVKLLNRLDMITQSLKGSNEEAQSYRIL